MCYQTYSRVLCALIITSNCRKAGASELHIIKQATRASFNNELSSEKISYTTEHSTLHHLRDLLYGVTYVYIYRPSFSTLGQLRNMFTLDRLRHLPNICYRIQNIGFEERNLKYCNKTQNHN